MSESNQHVTSGLLTKRQELMDETAALRERIAAIGNDIEAIDRVLDSFGYAGDLKGRSARLARIHPILSWRAAAVPRGAVDEGLGARVYTRAGRSPMPDRRPRLPRPPNAQRRDEAPQQVTASDAAHGHGHVQRRCEGDI